MARSGFWDLGLRFFGGSWRFGFVYDLYGDLWDYKIAQNRASE